MKKLLLLLALGLLLCGCGNEIDPHNDYYVNHKMESATLLGKDLKYLSYRLDKIEKKIDKLLEREW